MNSRTNDLRSESVCLQCESFFSPKLANQFFCSECDTLENVLFLEDYISVDDNDVVCVPFEEEVEHDDHAAEEALKILNGSPFMSLETFVA